MVVALPLAETLRSVCYSSLCGLCAVAAASLCDPHVILTVARHPSSTGVVYDCPNHLFTE